jgi:hypothetical protein
VWKKFDRAGDAGAARLWNVEAVTTVMVGGWAHIPSEFAVRRPAFSGVGIFKDQGPGAGWREWRSIEIEYAEELVVG